MAQFFSVHPEQPQPRLIRQAAELLREGGVLVIPTDSTYALAVRLGNADALERIRRIRRVDERHHLTPMCRDLSEIARYARVDNAQYRPSRPRRAAIPSSSKAPRNCRGACCTRSARPSGCAFRSRDGETGILVPSRDPSALAVAIGRALDDAPAAERWVGAAADLVRAEYTVEAMLDKIDAIYRTVRASGRAGRRDTDTARERS